MDDLRKQIDKIDDTIVELLKARFDLVKIIGEQKKEGSVQILDSSRENYILNRLKSEGVDPELIEKMYKLIFEKSRKLQENTISDK